MDFYTFLTSGTINQFSDDQLMNMLDDLFYQFHLKFIENGNLRKTEDKHRGVVLAQFINRIDLWDEVNRIYYNKNATPTKKPEIPLQLPKKEWDFGGNIVEVQRILQWYNNMTAVLSFFKAKGDIDTMVFKMHALPMYALWGVDEKTTAYNPSFSLSEFVPSSAYYYNPSKPDVYKRKSEYKKMVKLYPEAISVLEQELSSRPNKIIPEGLFSMTYYVYAAKSK